MNISNNLILIYENFLSNQECNNYINYFLSNKDKIKQYRNTFILKLFDPNLLNKLVNNFSIKKLNNPDNLEIVRWPENSFMDFHYDKGDDLSFIIYLNEDFLGGETIINDLNVKPKIGKIVIFSNGKLLHKVNKIDKGDRYTLIGWYK